MKDGLRRTNVPCVIRSLTLSALRVHCRALLLPALAALALAALALAGCGRAEKGSPQAQDSYAVTLATEPAQPSVGEGALVVTLADPSGRPVDGARLAVEANMSHAGMVPVNAEATGGKDGVYRVRLKWTMGGDWYVDVKFSLPDGDIIGRRFPVTVR